MQPQFDLASAILFTLAYSDQFNFALTLEELWQRLPAAGSLEECRAEVEKFCQIGVVLKADWQGKTYFYLNSAAHPRERHRRQQAATQAWQSADRFQHLLAHIPWVLAVGVTGSLAHDQFDVGDDVDVVIVTEPQTLWLTRLVVSALSWMTGHRRGWDGEARGEHTSGNIRWCTNLWLEKSAQVVPWMPSLYIAYELVHAKWLWDRGGVEKWWWERHDWLRTWLPNWPVPAWQESTAILRSPSLVIRLANAVAYYLQRVYMKPHQTREKVSRSQAFFHPRSTQELITSGWLTRLRRAITRVHLANRWQNWQPPVSSSRSLVENVPITLVTGVFDVIHREHVEFLRKARDLGGTLVVGVESDFRVRQLKGPTRPVFSQEVRVARLQQLGIAHEIFVLPEMFASLADYRALIHTLRPRYLAVSSHSPHLKTKVRLLREVGGTVAIVHNHNPEVSTTQLLAQHGR